MRVSVFGAVRVDVDGQETFLKSRRAERFLAALVISGHRRVPIPQLIDALWGERAPSTAPHQVRKLAGELRSKVPGLATALITEGAGYRLADHVTSDVGEFETLVAQAAETSNASSRVAALGDALALWAPLLGGQGDEYFDAADVKLRRRHRQAVTDHAEALLALGRAADAVPMLESLLVDDPCAEDLTAGLMRALYACGRASDALARYDVIRAHLSEELGVDPAPALQELQLKILRQDDDLVPESPGVRERSALSGASKDLWQLPPGAVRSLTTSDAVSMLGRDQLLSELRGASVTSLTPRVVELYGMPGTGKTTVATAAALAHQAAHAGQAVIVTVALLPADPDEVVVQAVLTELLKVVGDTQAAAADLTTLQDRWRAAMSAHRIALVLDAVTQPIWIQLLGPKASGALVVVTGRRRIRELECDASLPIPALPATVGADILVAQLGGNLGGEDQSVACDIAALLDCNPRVLIALARRLQRSADPSLAAVCGTLADPKCRLRNCGAAPDQTRSVAENVVDQALSLLSPEVKQLAWRLAHFPCPTAITHWSFAAWVRADSVTAAKAISELCDVGVLTEHSAGAFSVSELAACAFASEDRLSRESLEVRTCDFFAELTAMTSAVSAQRNPNRITLPGLSAQGDQADLSQGEAFAWFEAHFQLLTHLVNHPLTTVAQRISLRLDLSGYRQAMGDAAAAVDDLNRARRDAEALGNLPWVASIAVGQSESLRLAGRAEESQAAMDRSLELAHHVAPDCRAKIWSVHGSRALADGDAALSIASFTAAADALNASAGGQQYLWNLANLAWANLLSGDAETAQHHVDTSRAVAARHRHPVTDVLALEVVAFPIALALHDDGEAGDCLARARRLGMQCQHHAAMTVALAQSVWYQAVLGDVDGSNVFETRWRQALQRASRTPPWRERLYLATAALLNDNPQSAVEHTDIMLNCALTQFHGFSVAAALDVRARSLAALGRSSALAVEYERLRERAVQYPKSSRWYDRALPPMLTSIRRATA